MFREVVWFFDLVHDALLIPWRKGSTHISGTFMLENQRLIIPKSLLFSNMLEMSAILYSLMNILTYVRIKWVGKNNHRISRDQNSSTFDLVNNHPDNYCHIAMEIALLLIIINIHSWDAILARFHFLGFCRSWRADQNGDVIRLWGSSHMKARV